MRKIVNAPKGILAVLFVLTLAWAGCGGGGGSSDGGDPSITYTGLTTPAAITAANAEDLLTGSLLGVEAGGYFSLAENGSLEPDRRAQDSVISSDPIAIGLPLVLRSAAGTVSLSDSKRNSARSLARAVSDTIDGNCGGSATYWLNVDDATGAFNGTFDFSRYCEDDIVISGDTDISGTANLTTGAISAITYEFEKLVIDESIFKGNVRIDDTAIPRVIVLDVLMQDSVSGNVYWANDYSLWTTDLNATEPLLVSTGGWPIRGILLCAGVNNTKATLTAISASSYKIEADANGDDTYDYHSGVLPWPDAAGFTHSWTQITSDNRTNRGWTLKTEIGIDGISDAPQWAYGPDGSLGPFMPMDPYLAWTPPYPPIYEGAFLSGLPSDYNGYSFAWAWADENGSYAQTAVASGIREVPLSYNFNVLSGGEHPTFAWDNDDPGFSEYRIRVLNPGTEALLYQVSLDYAQFGAHPVYQLTEFSFLPGVTYLLRIEARQFVAPDTYSTPDGTIPLVLNRSTLLVTYTNSGA